MGIPTPNHRPTRPFAGAGAGLLLSQFPLRPITNAALEGKGSFETIGFLWATFPQLPEALRLIHAWGFRYKTVAFVWLKRNRKSPSWFYGMGYWTRSNAEICLLATRGKPKRQSAGVHQFIISPIEQHSKKPDEARDKILALMGDLPRVELFARQKTPGWDAWGNEIASDITLAERS